MRKQITLFTLVFLVLLGVNIQSVRGEVESVFGELKFNVQPDTTPPTISIESPNNITYVVNITDYNISVNERLNTALVSIDGGTNMSMGNDTITHYFNLSSQHPSLINGRHNATFYAEDLAGNGAFNIVYFTVDTTIPTSTVYVFVNPQDPDDYILWDLISEKWTFFINNVVVRCINSTDSVRGDCG